MDEQKKEAESERSEGAVRLLQSDRAGVWRWRRDAPAARILSYVIGRFLEERCLLGVFEESCIRRVCRQRCGATFNPRSEPTTKRTAIGDRCL